MTVLLLSYSFFDSVRQLMSATHTALAGVAAADKVSKSSWTSTPPGPIDPDLPQEEPAVPRHPRSSASPTPTPGGMRRAADDVSLTVEKGKVTALVGLSGCGKSTLAGLLDARFSTPPAGKHPTLKAGIT